MLAKLLRFAVGAAVVLTLPSVQAATTACSAVDFTSSSAKTYLASLNNILTISKSLLPTYLAAYDPFTVTNKTLADQTISALGYSFEIVPVLTSLNVTGISTVLPRAINVTANDTANVGVDFSGTLTAAGTFSLTIAQLNHKWYQVCWTDLLHPTKCASLTVALDFSVGLKGLSIVSDTVADLVACPSTTTTTKTCTDISITQLLVGVMSGSYTAILNRILRRFKDVSVDGLTLAFDSVSSLSFSFESTSTLIKTISATLLTYTKDVINKKGDAYKVVIALAQTLVKSLLNAVITDDLDSLFGSTCYDS